MSYFIAIDGGGTKTDFVLLDEGARVVARLQLGPSNYQNIGEPEALAVLQQGIAELLHAQALLPDNIRTACLGLAGLDTNEDERVYTSMVHTIFGDTAAPRVRIENDCYIGLHSGTLGEAGLALISGTGSMAIAVNENGQRARSGGWGFRFGDEGSGYYIGYEAMKRAVQSKDGRRPATSLVALLEDACARDLFDLVTQYNTFDPEPDTIAAWAPLVSEAAAQDDTVAKEILADAARELVAAAQAITNQLQFTTWPLRVVLAGGAFEAPLLRTYVTEGLQHLYDDVTVIRPELSPVSGAAVLALQHAGVPLAPHVLDTVRSEFAQR